MCAPPRAGRPNPSRIGHFQPHPGSTMLTPWRTVVLLVAAACGHDLPPEPSVTRPDSVPDQSNPPRLTLNQLMDLTPAYSIDGSTLWYTWERNDQADHDL